MATIPTNIRQTEEAKRLWQRIAEHDGVTAGAAREIVVREAAEKRGIPIVRRVSLSSKLIDALKDEQAEGEK